jgi:pSer/pThr/pTyr-binding forkhead associated (FHA) protein
VAFFDFLRRIGSGKDRSRQRGVRGQRMQDRRADQGTVQIGTPAMGYPSPPAAPPARATEPPPTVVTPRAEPMAPRPAPAAAPAAANTTAATEYVDVRAILPNQVVGVLVVIEGELEGEVYRVYDGDNRLGRSPDCEIELPSRKISREHAKLIHQDGTFAIAPLSGKNPTILNDEQTEGAELGDGDILKLGRTKLKFRSI